VTDIITTGMATILIDPFLSKVTPSCPESISSNTDPVRIVSESARLLGIFSQMQLITLSTGFPTTIQDAISSSTTKMFAFV